MASEDDKDQDDGAGKGTGKKLDRRDVLLGLSKLTTPGWSATGFLLLSRGPFGEVFRWMAAGPERLAIVNQLNIWGSPSSGSGSSSVASPASPAPLAFSSYCCTREPSS